MCRPSRFPPPLPGPPAAGRSSFSKQNRPAPGSVPILRAQLSTNLVE